MHLCDCVTTSCVQPVHWRFKMSEMGVSIAVLGVGQISEALSESLLEQSAVFTRRQFDTVIELGLNDL